MTSNEKTSCCFTGQRKIPPETIREISQRLEIIVVQLNKGGCTYFYSGGALEYDTLADQNVLKCRAKYLQTRLIDWIRAYEGEFETIEELEVLISAVNKDMNISINQETKMSPTALIYKEKEYLKPLPHKSIIDTYLTTNRYRVSSETLIRFNGNRYSVDPKLIDEDVTVDCLDNRLYIYYNGKLVTIHTLNYNPVNYKKHHYEQLMKGKITDADMETVVTGNLKMMDRLLDSRKVTVTEKDAVKSIAYINQSDYGRWIINRYAHLSDKIK